MAAVRAHHHHPTIPRPPINGPSQTQPPPLSITQLTPKHTQQPNNHSLPGRGTMGEPPSIMHAPYPTGVPAWHDPEAEARMAAVKETIHAARSLRAQYGLTPQVRTRKGKKEEGGKDT